MSHYMLGNVVNVCFSFAVKNCNIELLTVCENRWWEPRTNWMPSWVDGGCKLVLANSFCEQLPGKLRIVYCGFYLNEISFEWMIEKLYNEHGGYNLSILNSVSLYGKAEIFSANLVEVFFLNGSRWTSRELGQIVWLFCS